MHTTTAFGLIDLDLTVCTKHLRSAGAPQRQTSSWHEWDQTGLPRWLASDLVALSPEAPIGEQVGDLVAELDRAVEQHGARAGVSAFLAGCKTWDELLDARALVGALAQLSLDRCPRLALPDPPSPQDHRRRPLRPLEVVLVRTAAHGADNRVILYLLAAGGTEIEMAA